MTDHNHLSDAEAERLVLLVEEAGEVIAIAGKVLRHGYESRHPEHPDGPNNREYLARELGDLQAALELLTVTGDLSQARIEASTHAKIARIGRYLHAQGASGLRPLPGGKDGP